METDEKKQLFDEMVKAIQWDIEYHTKKLKESILKLEILNPQPNVKNQLHNSKP